jgi:hypothetical protein
MSKKKFHGEKKNWSQVPDGRLTPGQTGRLTVGRQLTHSLTVLLLPTFKFKGSAVCSQNSILFYQANSEDAPKSLQRISHAVSFPKFIQIVPLCCKGRQINF